MTLRLALRRVVRSPLVRAGFLVAALGGGAWAIASQWSEVRDSLQALSLITVAGAMTLSVLHVCLQMLCWRVVIGDMGSRLSTRNAGFIFFVSQAGKYIPGGVWNVLAAVELGSEHRIPRNQTISGMLVFWHVSVVTGLGAAAVAMPWTSSETALSHLSLLWALPVIALALVPPVLNRAIRLLFRLVRRDKDAPQLTAQGIGMALLWSLAAWGAAGLQVWILASAAGGGHVSLMHAIGAYALAWSAGFLFVLAPAGVGVRELALAGALGTVLGAGEVIVVVLMSRVLVTAADVLLAACAWAMRGTARSLAR